MEAGRLADRIGDCIRLGGLRPGVLLPGQQELCERYGVELATVRTALGMLRAQGLVGTVQGVGTRVRSSRQDTVVRLGPDDRIWVRMAAEEDLHGWGIRPGVPVLEVSRANGEREIHPSDRTTITN